MRQPSQHLPSLRTELCQTPPLLSRSVAWPPPTSLALGGPKALRPRLTTSLPFSPAHRRCACRPTSLLIGDRFATIFEVVGIFFDIFLVLRTEKVHRGFISARYGIGGVGLLPSLSSSSYSLLELLVGFLMAHPLLLSPYSPECPLEVAFCELRNDGVLRSSSHLPPT